MQVPDPGVIELLVLSRWERQRQAQTPRGSALFIHIHIHTRQKGTRRVKERVFEFSEISGNVQICLVKLPQVFICLRRPLQRRRRSSRMILGSSGTSILLSRDQQSALQGPVFCHPGPVFCHPGTSILSSGSSHWSLGALMILSTYWRQVLFPSITKIQVEFCSTEEELQVCISDTL